MFFFSLNGRGDHFFRLFCMLLDVCACARIRFVMTSHAILDDGAHGTIILLLSWWYFRRLVTWSSSVTIAQCQGQKLVVGATSCRRAVTPVPSEDVWSWYTHSFKHVSLTTSCYMSHASCSFVRMCLSVCVPASLVNLDKLQTHFSRHVCDI